MILRVTVRGQVEHLSEHYLSEHMKVFITTISEVNMAGFSGMDENHGIGGYV